MLDLGHEQSVIDREWESAEAKVRMPEPALRSFFVLKGPMPSYFENHRTHHRFYLRGKAVLRRHERLLGVYTKDVSRQGMGFLSPQQLLPKEQVELRLTEDKKLRLEITRCRRVLDGVFDCGGRFVL